MPLVKLDIPAGIYNHGNELDSKGRWLDSSLVRWTNNAAQPVGGWVQFAYLEPFVTNGDFSNSTAPTGWTASQSNTIFAISNGVADLGSTNPGTQSTCFQNISAYLTANETYTVEIELVGAISGSVTPVINGVAGTAITTLGVHRQNIAVGGTITDAANTGWRVSGFGASSVTNFRVYFGSNGHERRYRSSHAWTSNDMAPSVAAAAFDRIVMINGNGSVYDITPSAGFQGSATAGQATGYGGGNYGAGAYGIPQPDDYNNQGIEIAAASAFSLENWGQDLLAVSQGDGKLWELDFAAWLANPSTTKMSLVSASTNPTVIGTVPVGSQGIVVTAERFVFCLGADSNPRQIKWCDRENLYIWEPEVTNEAGDIELQTPGKLVAGVRVRGRTLLLTTLDVWTATYQGPPTVFGFQKIGDSCGLVAKNMVSSVGPAAFWMGENNFFVYDGSQAKVLPCEVHDKVFTELNRDKISHGWCVANQKYNEVWWFYPANGANECNRYVAYDYRENHWLIGSLERSTGVDSGSFADPWWVSQTHIVYRHETGYGYENDSVFLESGPINFSDGEQVARVTEVITEEDTQNDVSLSFKTKIYPNGAESTHTISTLSNPTSVRFTGRQLKMRIEGGQDKNWRLGDVRLRVSSGGTR